MNDQLQIRSILGVAAGVLFGWVAGLFFPQIMIHTSFPAALFEHALQLLVAPLLFTAIVVGVSSFGDMAKAGRSFLRLIWYFFGTGAVAVVVALLLAAILQPGTGVAWFSGAGMLHFDEALTHSLGDILQGIIPLNLPGSIGSGYYAGLLLFGFAIGLVLIHAGFKGRPFVDMLSIFLGLQKRIVHFINLILPIGLFCIIGSAVAKNAASFSSMLDSVSAVLPTLLIALGVFGLILLPAIQWLLTGESPLKYLINIKPALATAFASGSSTAAFPILFHTVSEQRDDSRASGLSLPFGLLLGTHGSTILTVVLTLFVVQAIGISLDIWQYVIIALTAIFIPVGVVGFPMAQVVLLGGLFHALNFPAEAFALLGVIWSGDWLMSRLAAPINTMSSAVAAAVVAGSFDLKTARHTPQHRPSGFRPDDRRRGQHQGSEQRERRHRDERSTEQRSSAPGGQERRHGRDRDKERGDRPDRFRSREGRENREPREGRENREERGERNERGERHQGRGRFQGGERPNRFQNRDDRRRFPRERQERETTETGAEVAEKEPVAQHTPEIVTESRYTPPQENKPEAQEPSQVAYGRSARPRHVEREGGSESSASETNRPNVPEQETTDGGEVSYGRGRRRQDFVKSESTSESTSSGNTEEESVVTGELSFGRGKRRPQGK